MKFTKCILVLAVAVSVFFFLGVLRFTFSWFEQHDRDVEKASELYTSCIEEEYRMTPAAYNQEHGYFPECSHELVTTK